MKLEALAKEYEMLLAPRFPDLNLKVRPDPDVGGYGGGILAVFSIPEDRAEEYARFIIHELPFLVEEKGLDLAPLISHTPEETQQNHPRLWEEFQQAGYESSVAWDTFIWVPLAGAAAAWFPLEGAAGYSLLSGLPTNTIPAAQYSGDVCWVDTLDDISSLVPTGYQICNSDSVSIPGIEEVDTRRDAPIEAQNNSSVTDDDYDLKLAA